MTAPESEALAAWLEERWKIAAPKTAPKFRECADALRSMAAERDALMAVAGNIIDQDIDGHVTRIESQVASLRRKVARYIGKARGWRLAYRLLDSLLSFGEKK